jgi:hypothetical protein
MSELEAKIMRHNVFYIHTIEREIVKHRVVFHFLKDPQSAKPEVIRILTFTNISDFSEQWYETEDKNHIESLIGITERPEGAGVRYHILLEQSEIIFYTETEPQVD